MPRTLLACVIGFFSFFAWFGGAALFEVPGRNSAQENVAGSVLLILYMVLGQFLLPQDPDSEATADWHVRAGMAAPLLAFALLFLVTERDDIFIPMVSMLAGGCIGVLLGGFLARSPARSTRADAARAAGISKSLGNTGAALYLGVSVILSALVVPTLMDTARYNLPPSASYGIVVLAALHAVFAAVVLWRTRQGKAPVFAAIFGFLMTMTLAGIGAADIAHWPEMRLASIALFVCALTDMIVCACCTGMAIQHHDVPALLAGHQ